MTRYLLKPTSWDSDEPGYAAVNDEIAKAWEYIQQCDPETCEGLLGVIITSAFGAGWQACAANESARDIAKEIEAGLHEIVADFKAQRSKH